MKRKSIWQIILPLLFCISLNSCMHEDFESLQDSLANSTSAKNTGKMGEYSSATLWKEDETYIKNVMDVYAQHETEIKKTVGDPLWNYAMTMGFTNESFLKVPVVDNGKVVSVLKVPRYGNKIYFIYTSHKEDIDFFTSLLSPNVKKAEGGVIVSGTDKITCHTEQHSVWNPDDGVSEPGAGSGHWEYSSTTECVHEPDHFETCFGVVLPSGECDGGSGPDDGYDYPDGGGDNGDNPPADPPTPCEQASLNNIQSKALLAKTSIASARTTASATIATDTQEKTFAFGTNATGDYETTPIQVSAVNNQGHLVSSYPGLTVEGGGHTHYAGLFASFSAGDIYTLQGANVLNPHFKTLFVFGDGNLNYALTITNPVKYAAFVAAYSAGNNLDLGVSHWKTTSPLYTYFETALTQFQGQGLTDDDAFASAMALLLKTYDVGATISQEDASGDFKTIFSQEGIINVNVNGISVPIKTYSQTTNCNL